MPNMRIPQAVALRVALKAYLSTDHVSVATGKTLAVVISKNCAAFGNPSGGATNATEISNGWYYVDLSTTDAGTLGPLIVRGTASGVDDVEAEFYVVNAHNQGFDGVADAVAGAAGGVAIVGSIMGKSPATLAAADVSGNVAADVKAYTVQPTVTNATLAASQHVIVDSGTVTSVTNDVGITQTGADKVWGTAARALTDKAGFALSTASILAIWNQLTADAGILASTFGAKLKNWVLGTDSKTLISTDAQDLSATFSVNAKKLNGATPNNISAADVRDVNNTAPAANSLGAKVNSAASAGDPWATNLPGAYGVGTAGNILGNNLDAQVSSVGSGGLDAAGVRAAVGLASANLDSQFSGVNGNIDTIPTNPLLTTDSRLDNLDDTITSRAPSSTALSTLVWTNARAAYLDTINQLELLLPKYSDVELKTYTTSITAITGAAVPGARAWLTQDNSGLQLVQWSVSAPDGSVVFHVPANTYYLWALAPGYVISNPKEISVT